MTETVPSQEGTVAATTYREPESVEETATEESAGPSYTATRFGLGFVAGMFVAAVAGVATGMLGPALMFGVAFGMVAGVAYAELAD